MTESTISAAVVAAEQRLLDPAVRADATQVAELLHEDFVEFGASGRRWDRASIIEALSSEPALDLVRASQFETTSLASDVCLLTYGLESSDGASLRSSVWQLADERWQLRFHQGTPAAH